ncbi:MAG: hypothetical protein IKF47_01205 [Bacilli bacterium]|nr:hypothetical protein [Bacilli bacterium]
MKKIKKHKWKYRINLRKKILVLVILGVSLFVGLGYAILESNLEIFGTLEVSKYDRTLYTALKKEVSKGYALKYTGAHQDSMDPSKSTEDIYHFYGSTAAKGTEILNKNNVLFADKCWQMIRTTDTGGVKLLYNGEPETSTVNGETQYNCGDTRTLHHIGGILKELNLSGTYKYAKNYTATTSGAKTTFTLVDDPNDPNDCKTITVNESNAQSVIEDIIENYPYTCRNTSGTCAYDRYDSGDFYRIDSYASSTYAKGYKSTLRDLIGGDKFYNSTNPMLLVGYMHGDEYVKDTFRVMENEDFSPSEDSVLELVSPLSTNYYYADSYDYGETTPGTYTLINPTKLKSLSEHEKLKGKYVIVGATSGSSIMYVGGSIYWAGFGSGAYVKKLSGGDSDVSISLSDDIIDNGDGTYSLSNQVTTVELKTWYDNSSQYLGKYTCGNSATTCVLPRRITQTASNYYKYIDESQEITLAKARNGLELIDYITISLGDFFRGYNTTYNDYVYTCGNNDTTCTKSNLRYILSKDSSGYKYAKNYNFGASVIYEDGKYKLQNVEGLEAIENMNTLSTHHYTCIDSGESECAFVAYVYLFSTGLSTMNYIKIDDPNVTDINTAIDNMLAKNTKNSNAKKKIDEWYERNLKDTVYEAKIDDTIYCNDRSFAKTGEYTFEKSGWNPNGGKIDTILYFNEGSVSKNLSCKNITDRFSVSNNEAKLTYKIGLLTAPEANLLNQASARVTASQYGYILLSPSSMDHTGSYISEVKGDGSFSTSNVKTNTFSDYRPVISLIAGTEYTKGDGSMTNPYIVRMD